MLLLRNKEQQQNHPLASIATSLCRQRSRHELIIAWHDTRTVNK